MNTSQETHVFISYSHGDEVFVKRLVADLQARRIRVWIADSGIPLGTPDWEDALREALSKAYAVILIASPQSRSSRYVRDELSIAETYKHRIYPVWADGTQWMDCIPLGYGRIQYIDARGARYQSALDRLVSELATLSASTYVAEPSSNPSVSPKLRGPAPIATSQHSTRRIFVAHSHLDNDFGSKLTLDLRQAIGNEQAVWYDALGGLHGGDIWWEKIVEELKARDIFLLVLSPDSMNSQWVRSEIYIAMNEGKTILPILYRDCNIRTDLQSQQIISFLAPKSYQQAFQEILVALDLPM